MSVLEVPDDGLVVWPSLGAEVCDWIEDYLVFGPGDLRGEPAVIDDEKRLFIYRIYEIYPEGHEFEGRRRFKRAGLSQAKGLAKTEFAAWIAAAELSNSSPVRCIGWTNGDPIGGPVTDPYIPMVAYTEEQSDELAYGALRAILEESVLRDEFDIGLERILRVKGDGKAVSLSSSPSARDGARTTFQLADETHWWTSDKLKKAHQTMLANIPKRRIADAWALEVTTAYEPGAGSVAEDTHQYARAIDEGRAEDARLFFFHREAGEEHDLTTEDGARAAVIEASGSAASWRDVESIVELWRQPTTDRQFWERVWCNRPVQSARKAFDIVEFRKLKKSVNIPRGALVTVGFDGAQFNDATGLVVTDIRTGHQWSPGAWECPYLAENWQVPVEDVDACVDSIFEYFNVWRMYCDPPYWQSWVSTWQGRYGDERVIEWWTNRRRQMALALELYETAIADGELSHDGGDVLVRHVGNAHRHELPQRHDVDARPLWLIRKETSNSPLKIDVCMAAVLAWEARNDAIASGITGDIETVFSATDLEYWDRPPEGGNRYILMAPANEKKASPEYTDLIVLETRTDRTYLVHELVRERLSMPDRVDLLFDFHRKYDPLKVGVEKRGLESDNGHISERQKRENYRFKCWPIDSKLTEDERIKRLVPLIEKGRLVLPKKSYVRNGVDMVAVFRAQELTPYPYGAHTSLLDLLSRVFDLKMQFPADTTVEMPTVYPSDF